MYFAKITRAFKAIASPMAWLGACFRTGIAVLAATVCVAASADTFPNRPVKIVVPFAPGGNSDLQVRMLSERLGKLWSQPVVVENVSGAGGGVAAAQVARSRPDGYTLLFATHPILSINPFLYPKLPYDPQELMPVVELAETHNVLLVNTASNLRTLSDVIQQAKATPGRLHFGSGGIGTSQHLAGELFKTAANIDIVHVPYRGTGPATVALLTNEIELHFDSAYSATAQIKGGKARAIAITSKSRYPMLSDVPTMDESGLKGFEVMLAYGLLVPAGTPRDVVATINRDVNKVLQDPAYRDRMQSQGMMVRGGTSEEFGALLESERKKWGQLIKRLDIKLD